MSSKDINDFNLPAEAESSLSEIALDDSGFPVENVIDSFEAIQDITKNVCNAITSWKQIDYEMHKMDVTFNTFMAKLDFDLDRYKTSIPVVERQLSFVNDQISKILNHVLSMNAETEVEMQMKMRMLESSEKYLDKLSTMMMKLI